MQFKSKPNLSFHINGNMKRFDNNGFYKTEDKEEIETLKNMDGVEILTQTEDKKQKGDKKNG